MKKWKYRLKKGLALILLAAVIESSTETGTLHAWAGAQNGGLAADEDFAETILLEEELPDQDELLEGYLYQRAYEELDQETAFYGNLGAARLTGDEKAIYEALKVHAEEIAAGRKISSEVTVSGFASLKSSQVEEAVRKVISYLLMDCPYDLYWYDKTAGYKITWGPKNNDALAEYITFSLKVAMDYQGADSYTVDRSKTGAVDKAVNTAQSIVKKYENQSDYNKLKAYLKEICDRAAYNTNATVSATPYGNPWQLIWVFDDNSNTNVVCEGYSKAFQYLCDLSFFSNAACYTVTGTMDGGKGAGSHMWNIVTLNGKSYLVDVTNCDTGTIGASDKLFLTGTDGSIENGYTFSINNRKISYKYSGDQQGLLGDVLKLAEKPYEEDPSQELKIQAPTAGDVTFGDAVSENILRGGSAENAGNQRVQGKFKWSDEVTSYGTVGKNSLKAVFIPDDSQYNAVNVLVEVTVKKKSITVKADPQSKAYGQPDPELTYTAQGVVEGCPLAGALERQNGESVGSYSILQGGLTEQKNPNYTIAFTGNTLEISAGDCIVAVNEKQNIRPGTGDFIEPKFTDAEGNSVEGTLTYTYNNRTYTTYEALKTELAKLPEDRSGTISYAFQPKNSDYNAKNGTIEFTVKLIEFLVGSAPAAIDNAVTIKNDAVYGDSWADIVKIGNITTKVGSSTDSTPGHFTLSKSGMPEAGMGQSFQVLYNGTIDGKEYANEIVCSGSVDVKKRTVIVEAGSCKISKVYDKTRAPGTAVGDLALRNIVVGDEGTLDITVTPAAYGDPNVSGQDKVTATLELDGLGAKNYELGSNSLEIPGEITPKAITPTVSVSGSYSYTGSAVTPALTVADGSDVLAQSDYDMVLSNNRGVGTAKVSVKPKNGGNYTWSPAVEASFVIDKGSYAGTKNMSVSAKCGSSASFSVSSLFPAGYKLGTIRVEDRDQIFTSTPTLSGANISYSMVNDNAKAGKTAVITIPITESTDYQAFDVTVTITALSADQNSGSGSNNSNNSNSSNNNNNNNNNNNSSSGSGGSANGSDNVQYSLSMETGIAQVPQTFSDIESLNTAAKIEAQIKQELQKKAAGVTQERIAVYDVTLMVNINNAGWKTADKDNFPKDGLTVTIPYPSGTDRNKHDFIVSHMFTEEMNGHKPGEIEYPSVTKTADGLQFKVNGLSPVSVGWAETGKLNTASTGTGVNSPKTADASPVLAYLLLMFLSAGMFGYLCAAGYRRKYR